ncbi:hypothetical protein [uncultured Draconibacterium sp.]|uniref:hypothetical protein n=1 Tax=uncultured Draconibacterium sp. TaxID=1573823 RepID=UPI0025FC0FBD|nr:hypothetical protein [uncultured Draconibacterium sp.]
MGILDINNRFRVVCEDTFSRCEVFDRPGRIHFYAERNGNIVELSFSFSEYESTLKKVGLARLLTDIKTKFDDEITRKENEPTTVTAPPLFKATYAQHRILTTDRNQKLKIIGRK